MLSHIFWIFDPWPWSVGSRHLIICGWRSSLDHLLNSSQSCFFGTTIFCPGGQLFDRLVSLGRYKAQGCCIFWFFHWESTHGGCVGCSTFQLLSSQEAKAACVVQEILEVQRVTDAFWFPRFLLLEHTLIRFSWLFSLHRKRCLFTAKPFYEISSLFCREIMHLLPIQSLQLYFVTCQKKRIL